MFGGLTAKQCNQIHFAHCFGSSLYIYFYPFFIPICANAGRTQPEGLEKTMFSFFYRFLGAIRLDYNTTVNNNN